MKTATLTHCKLSNGILTLHNGFSFAAHHLDVDHLFVCNNKYPDLSKYDKILLSASFRQEIPDNVDERWIIGGPAVSNQFPGDIDDKWIEGGATICKQSLEEYLGVPRDDVFTPYWNSFISNLNLNFIKYSASCSTRCYYNECVYCNKKYHIDNSYRSVSKVISQLPIYPYPAFCYMIQGSVYPDQLEEAIKNPKGNIMYRIHARSDPAIIKLIEEAKDLSHIGLILAGENFSQTCSDKVNKNLSMMDTLKLAKTVTTKGGKVLFTMISKAPFCNEIETKNSLQYIIMNLPPDKVMFWDSVYIEWPDEKTASKFGKYTVKNVPRGENNHFIMDNNIIIVTDPQPEVEYISEMIINNLRNYGFWIETRL